LQYYNLIDYLKDRFAIVIIDLPPILGLAETVRLATAADSIALVIRWGRTERQLVQFAVDSLRSASVSTIAVLLNDIDLKTQRRRGYRDSTTVYTDKGLYRTETEYREPAARAPLPIAAAKPDERSEASRSELQRSDDAFRDRRRPAGSDIERLYNKYHD
jgi:Mrp family chromosome partitioning ATPase